MPIASNATAWLNFAQLPREHGGLGLAPHQAAGLVGNLVKESGPDLQPWGPTGDNGTAWGTAQWRGDRLQGLRDYAQSKGLDPKSIEAQQGFMRSEMDGPENKAYRALTAASTPEDAATAVNTLYERSADRTGGREKAARDLMAQFGLPSSPAGDSQAMAYSQDQQQTAAPQTAPDMSTMGQLSSFLNKMNYANPKTGYDLSDALQGAGAAMMANDNASGAAALIKLQQQQQKQDTVSKYEYDPKSGTFFRTRKDGTLETMKNPNATDEAPKPKLTDKVLKNLSDNTEKYGAISQISDEGSKVLDDLNSGKLDLGALKNMENAGRNMAGVSNEQSLAYARYKQFIQKLADTELLKAKGVQTEGDAYRVMQEIGAGGAGYDTQAAKESITKLLLRNKDAVLGHGRSIHDAYAGAYGTDNAAITPFTQQFDGFKKVYDNIDSQLEKYKPAAAAPAPQGGFRVIKQHP